MIYGVFSDVHANLEALSEVLGFFEEAGVEGHVCCGDLVGYGPDPDPCLDRVRALKNLFVVAGNHDLAVLGRLELDWFNQYARASVLWTRGRLSGENARFLESLSARLDAPGFTVVHGTPRNPPEEYLLTPLQFRDSVPLVKTWPLFVGHSHMPIIFRFSEGGKIESRFLEDREEVLSRDGKAFAPAAINPGSVGQPRDQDNRASCGLFDSETGTFRAFRLPYDVRAVQAKIRAEGLPEHLALRLAFGQ